MNLNTSGPDLLRLTADIVAAYVVRNPVQPAALPALVEAVHASLARLSGGEAEAPEAPARPVPAVPVRRSVTPDYIVCLEDGRKFKSLRRHLSASYGLTPEEYRERWGLPEGYPMVAPNYAKKRSALAKEAGFGQRQRAGRLALAEAAPAPRKRGAPGRRRAG